MCCVSHLAELASGHPVVLLPASAGSVQAGMEAMSAGSFLRSADIFFQAKVR